MASQTFTLGQEKKDTCVKILLVVIAIGVVSGVIIAGIYVFKTTIEHEYPGCQPPTHDPNGFSNWTIGADVIAVGCFSDHSIKNGKTFISSCVNNEWIPEPPSCVALPLHLVCTVNKDGINGTIHMLQLRKSEPLEIYGILSTLEIDKTNGLLSEEIALSKSTCVSSGDFNVTIPKTNLNSSHSHEFIQIMFKSKLMVAYKRVDLRIIMVFIDIQKTATLVSVTQDGVTFVMPNPIFDPSTDWSWQGISTTTTGYTAASTTTVKTIPDTPKSG